MADREDIDALLIGALYGELAEADRARLEAHLTTHPQDRMSLEAMRSTRGLLRDADVAAAMVEPPASVSALLLQEAARRAPAVRTADSGGGLLGFLAGLLRPVMAHPALSAAAMLIVTAGAAGALYMRGGAKVVQPERAGTAALAPAEPGMMAPAAPTTMPAGDGFERKQEPDFEAAVATAGRGQAADAPADLLPRAGDDLDGYRVSLEEGKQKAGKEQSREELGFLAARTASKDDAGGAGRDKATAGPFAKGEAPAADYLQVDGERDAPSVRDLRDDSVAGEIVADGRVPARRQEGLTAQGQAMRPSPPPAATTPSPDGKLVAAGSGAGSAALDGSVRSTAVIGGAPGATQPTKPAGTSAGAAAAAPMPTDPSRVAPYNARSDAATLTWARDQHARLVKQVEAGKCNDAGVTGAAIMRRAPDYYQDNVFNDRRVRACRAYVEKARRAADPARKRDLPSPAAMDEAMAPDKASN